MDLTAKADQAKKREQVDKIVLSVEIVTKEMLRRDIVSETPSLGINLLKSVEESLQLFLFLKMVSF